ncbi:MAG: HlyD family efflux transporter periplasmic adaptor subunit [Syntrophorhabdus aromaticivorans]|uniref:HlyD family efflux transporter periplasmic adaptor subunit n=1 Tax=Syntrophorhabdus aromaticivorans TaxID=328301 RepID=A0A971M3K2_9BACT|nr:HlyD family efflux transporter periplasmic adaptor subunit [Syntrophorhabdus aromaticivorans]
MKKKRLIIVAVIILALGAVFLVNHFRNRKETGVISLSGNVEVTETNIGFKMPGRIVKLAVDEGDRVKDGDILANLDSAELTSVVAQNRAILQEAMTRLAELKAGSRSQEIEQARANVSVREAELTKAKKDFDRADMLFKNGAISASQFDLARSAYDARLAQRASAVEALSLAKEGPRKEQVQAARERVEQARAALTTAEERLRDTSIYAPTAGVILRKNVEAGETVSAGTPIFTIGDLENPWVKVYVKEDQLGLVKIGQKAEVKVDSFKGKTYEGTITYISSEAEFTPKNVQTQEERVKLVFGIKVRVKNINEELKPGMPADVRIALK